jgi:glycosyltransferase involved in cell wall biosynthesis
MRRQNPDVIHFDDVSRRMLLALPELGRRPVVLTIHDPEIHSGERSWRAELDRRIMLRRAARVLLYNNALRPAFARRYRVPLERIHPTHLGVHHIFREWAVGPLQHVGRSVLFYGRLSPYKGLEVLYEAAPLVAERVPGVRFVVAGRPVRGYQLPPAPRLPNGGQVEVIADYISNARLAELLQSTRVVACPYVDATQSGVALTGLAFEKPVVATRVGGIPEYIEHGQTGLLVPPRDAAALADALVALLTDAALDERLRAAIARLGRAGRLDWADAARATLAMYAGLPARR